MALSIRKDKSNRWPVLQIDPVKALFSGGL
jgi:hypothetical protein